MDRALPLVQNLTLAELLQLLIIIANRMQVLTAPPPPAYHPPQRNNPVRGQQLCGFPCMIYGAPCGRKKEGHNHHRCYQHRHQ